MLPILYFIASCHSSLINEVGSLKRKTVSPGPSFMTKNKTSIAWFEVGCILVLVVFIMFIVYRKCCKHGKNDLTGELADINEQNLMDEGLMPNDPDINITLSKSHDVNLY